MKLHFGATEYAGALRFFRGTIRAKGYKDQHCYFEHPIKRMYGISGAGARWFLGLITVDGTHDARSSDPPPSEGRARGN